MHSSIGCSEVEVSSINAGVVIGWVSLRQWSSYRYGGHFVGRGSRSSQADESYDNNSYPHIKIFIHYNYLSSLIRVELLFIFNVVFYLHIIPFGLLFMLHHHCVLLLGFFELLGLYYDFLQDQGLYFSIIDVGIGVRDCCSQRCHAWYDDDEDPTVTEV